MPIQPPLDTSAQLIQYVNENIRNDATPAFKVLRMNTVLLEIIRYIDGIIITGGGEPTIAPGTTAQYWRGDKTWQTLNNVVVGLGNVQNVDQTNAANLLSGLIPAGRYGASTIPISAINATGTPSASTVLFGDGTWGTYALSDGDKGDITISSGGTVWTIDDDAITLNKLPEIDANRVLGRILPGVGDVAELTGAEVTTMLSVFTSALNGVVPFSGGGTINFLRADGVWADPTAGAGGVTDGDKGDVVVSGGGTVWTIDSLAVTNGKINDVAFSKVTGTIAAAQVAGTATNGYVTTLVAGVPTWQPATGTLADGDYGDIVVTSSGAVWTIENSSVTVGKMQNISTASFLGRATAGSGIVEVLTGTQATELLNVFTSTLKGLVPLSGGGTTNFLRADGTWAAPPGGGGSYTDEQAQDAVGAMVNATLTYVDATPLLGINLGNANTWTANQSGPIVAYDATTWNGSAVFVTQDAIRDKIEAIIAGGASGLDAVLTISNTSDLAIDFTHDPAVNGTVRYITPNNYATDYTGVSALVARRFRETIGRFDGVNASGRPNIVYMMGYNVNGGGGREFTDDASFHWALESHFETGGGQVLEYHHIVNDTAGNAHRLLSYTIQKTTGQNLMYFTSESIEFRTIATGGAGYIHANFGTNAAEFRHVGATSVLTVDYPSAGGGTVQFDFKNDGQDQSILGGRHLTFSQTGHVNFPGTINFNTNSSTGVVTTFTTSATVAAGALMDFYPGTDAVRSLRIGNSYIETYTGIFLNYTGGGEKVALLANDGVLHSLANTTDGYVLTLVSGAPAWAAGAGGSNWTVTGSDIYRTSKVKIGPSGTPAAQLHIHSVTNADAWIQSGEDADEYAQMVFANATTLASGNYAEFIRFSNATTANPGDFIISNLTKSLVFSTTYSAGYRRDLEINSNGAIGVNNGSFGTSGQVLTSSGSGSAPTWTTVSGGGDMFLNSTNTMGASGDILFPVNGSETDFRVGAFELQGRATNYTMLGQNLYYNGTDIKHRATGAGSYIALVNGDMTFNVAPSASAGATATVTTPLGVASTGIIIGGSGYYVNFNGTAGASGHGFWDDGGVMKSKDAGGSWVGLDNKILKSGTTTLTGDITLAGGSANSVFITGSGSELFKITQTGAGFYGLEIDSLEYGANIIAGVLPLNLHNDSTNTNALRPIASYYRDGANGANGIGLSHQYYIKSSTGSVPQAAEVQIFFSNATNAAEHAVYAITLKNAGGGTLNEVVRFSGEGHMNLPDIATYADEAAAVTGGLATGTFYKTATGEVRIKL